jgi:hypothetical protein
MGNVVISPGGRHTITRCCQLRVLFRRFVVVAVKRQARTYGSGST